MRSGMEVGAVGETDIERNEAPEPRVPGLGWALGIAAVVAISVFAVVWVATTLDPAGSSVMADARNAAVAVEGFASDHGGSYADATVEGLTLPDASLGERLELYAAPSSYVIAVDDGAGVTFSLRRDYEGNEWLSCAPAGQGACPATGEWH